MRNLKFISLMMGCLAAVCVTFTSCDDDDDDSRRLTPQEEQAAFSQVRGSHSGTLIYVVTDSKTGKQSNDSIASSWNINTDSTMTIYDFPIALIANSVSDTAFSNALKTQAPVDLQCYIGFINVSPATFLINPVTPELHLTYGGKEHKVQIPFYVNTYYSYGQLNGSQLVMQIIAGGIYEDGKQVQYLSNAVPFGLVENKKK